MRQSLTIIATLALLIEGAAAQTHPIRIRGTIISAKGDDLTVKTRQGKRSTWILRRAISSAR